MKSLILGIVLSIGSIFCIQHGFKLYHEYTEVKDFAYAALSDGIERYPNDQVIIGLIIDALTDGEIIGKEHRKIFDYLIEKHGVYTHSVMKLGF